MADDFYGDMADMVDDLLLPTDAGGLGQGSVALRRMTYAESTEPGEPGQATTEYIILNAAAVLKDQRFESGALIVGRGALITLCTRGPAEDGSAVYVLPDMDDAIVIDGDVRSISAIKRIPEAGTIVAWQVFCSD